MTTVTACVPRSEQATIEIEVEAFWIDSGTEVVALRRHGEFDPNVRPVFGAIFFPWETIVAIEQRYVQIPCS